MEIERRLAAILAADVEGYSRLMSADEEGTLRSLTARRAAIDPPIARHRGRIVGTAGDSVLAEFASVVDAVSCALAVQAAMAEANSGEPVEKQMRFRIGINLGDVLVKGGDIFGDGVNVAARLEALAEPGGICVSGTVRDHVAGKVEASFVDLGEQQVKNIAQPVRAWRVGPSGPAGSAAPTAVSHSGKPSLVVLPFQNMSGDPEQEYFADGMTEEITTALSRIRQFVVIARNTAFTYKGRKLDLKQVGRELGVRYLLEGSVRKAGNRVRITGQLIDATSGAHVWADRFEGVLDDVFDLQDRVTRSVVGAIEPAIKRSEIDRVARKPPASLDAHDCLLRAVAKTKTMRKEDRPEAFDLARRAVHLDPEFAEAWSWIAFCVALERNALRISESAVEVAEGIKAAHLAVQLAPDDPATLAHAAFAISVLEGDVDMSRRWLDRAIAINPDSLAVLSTGAIARLYAGQYEIAAEYARRAAELSPLDPETFTHHATGISLVFRRRLEEALPFLRRAMKDHPRNNASLYLASALAHLGRLDEAREAIRQYMADRPRTGLSHLRSHRQWRVAADYDYVLEGARIAGLPE